MKRVDLIKAIEGLHCVLLRHGGKHDWYRNPQTGVSQAVPRHREIKEHLARHILKALSTPEPEGNGPGENAHRADPGQARP
jgi:predicted RNA binding protein YcfA (HicA-like mRNA interferase family)